MIALHHGTADAFADMMIANFDEMLRQSRKQSLVYGIALHAFIMGQPFRIAALRRAFEHLTKAGDATWFATTGAIADHFVSHGPTGNVIERAIRQPDRACFGPCMKFSIHQVKNT